MIVLRYFFVFFMSVCLGGCSGSLFEKKKVHYAPLNKSRSLPVAHPSVQTKLLSQYEEWKGTRFREGGVSKKGVDCSGFVQITFRSKLGIDVPRSTDQQVEIGRPVARNNLRAGDLVFFKTGFFSRHVGISLGGARFLHVSLSKGVIISSLAEEYWDDNYWQAKRVIM